MYLLDTQLCLDIIKKAPPKALERLLACSPDEVGSPKAFRRISGLKVENWVR